MSKKPGIERSDTSVGVHRRSYLRLLGAGAIGSVASGVASATHNVIDLGNEGLNDGDTIDPYLDTYWETHNEVHIPEGSYQWNGEHLGGTINDAALIGDGAGATFDIGDGGDVHNTLTVSSGSTHLQNITVKGKAGSGKNRLAWQCTDSSATLTIDNFDLPDGSYGFGQHPSPIGMFVRDDNVGTVTIKNCSIKGWANNGIYSTGSPGATIVECCHLEDNDIDNIRLGDADEIHDCLIEMRQSQAGRGVRVRYDGNMLIDGLHIINDAGEDPMVSARMDSAHCDLNNVYIENNTNNDAIRVEDGEYDVDQNVNITGSGSWATTGTIIDESLIEKGSSATSPESSMSAICGTTTQVDEDFSHNDIPGTYSLDTGAYTTSSTRSTSDSYSLLVDDGSNGASIILRDDMVTSSDNTYELDVYHQSGSNADMGFLFGAQSGVTGWSDFAGYMGFFDSNDDEIRVSAWDDGTKIGESQTATTWPLDEWLTIELDYRDSSTDLAVTVFDASGSQVASVSLADTTYDSGTIGFYNWHATSDWHADTWLNVTSNDAPSCSIASPSGGATVTGTETIQVSASDAEDDDTTLDVDVAIDGGTWQSAAYDSTSGYYEYDWDTTAESDGSHTIDARTTDSDGATTQATQISVTVDNVTEVAEDFSHNDVPGTYSLDTGAYTTSSLRSTSDSYSLLVNDGSDGASIILRDDMVTTAGNTYRMHVYHQSGSNADMGILFGAQSGVTGWSDFAGYMGFFDSNDDEIRVSAWDDGTKIGESLTATNWPLDEWLTVELDYRASGSSAIAVTVYDAVGSEIASVSLSDTTHDSGGVGFYNWHATSDWHADSWFRHGVSEDFSHNDVPGTYSLDTGAYTTSSTRSTSDSYSLLVDDGSDGASIVLRDDMVIAEGNTYELDVYHQSGNNADMGLLFGAQVDVTGWSDYTGYMGFFDSNDDEIRVSAWDDGTKIGESLTATTWPLDEWLTVELDYRDSTSDIAMTVFDASDSQVASVSLSDASYDSGTIGFYNWHATSDWHADTWFDV